MVIVWVRCCPDNCNYSSLSVMVKVHLTKSMAIVFSLPAALLASRNGALKPEPNLAVRLEADANWIADARRIHPHGTGGRRTDAITLPPDGGKLVVFEINRRLFFFFQTLGQSTTQLDDATLIIRLNWPLFKRRALNDVLNRLRIYSLRSWN